LFMNSKYAIAGRDRRKVVTAISFRPNAFFLATLATVLVVFQQW
jgi:hypothetical protein